MLRGSTFLSFLKSKIFWKYQTELKFPAPHFRSHSDFYITLPCYLCYKMPSFYNFVSVKAFWSSWVECLLDNAILNKALDSWGINQQSLHSLLSAYLLFSPFPPLLAFTTPCCGAKLQECRDGACGVLRQCVRGQWPQCHQGPHRGSRWRFCGMAVVCGIYWNL